MHSNSTQQQSNASLQHVQEAHLSGHQGPWDDPAVKRRGETERHISIQHEAVKQIEPPAFPVAGKWQSQASSG